MAVEAVEGALQKGFKVNLTPLFTLLWVYVESLLNKVLDTFWDALWVTLAESAIDAEATWTESGSGANKKAAVVSAIMQAVEARGKLNLIQKKLVSLFVNKLVDILLNELNGTIGKDWGAKVMALKEYWSDRLPIVD
jgi:hypothetical protein